MTGAARALEGLSPPPWGVLGICVRDNRRSETRDKFQQLRSAASIRPRSQITSQDSPGTYPPLESMQTAITSLVLLSLLVPGLSAQSDSWPGFRGPGRDGVALNAIPPVNWSDEDNIAWRADLPGPGSSSPVVLGDRVYLSCYSGYGYYLDDGGEPQDLQHHLLCFDRASGEQIWETIIPGPLEKEARKVQISEHGFATPTPVTDGEHLFAFLGRAGIVALDLDGEVLWQARLGEPSQEDEERQYSGCLGMGRWFPTHNIQKEV